jgi:hypothetical protein
MDNRVLIWRRPCEEWTPLCLNPGRSVRVSLMITYEGVGNLTVVDSNINAQKYIVHFNIKSLIILFGPLLHVISLGNWFIKVQNIINGYFSPCVANSSFQQLTWGGVWNMFLLFMFDFMVHILYNIKIMTGLTVILMPKNILFISI